MAKIGIKFGIAETVLSVPKLIQLMDTVSGTAVGDLLKLTGVNFVEEITSNAASEIPNGIFGVAYSKPTTITVEVIFVGIVGSYSGLAVGDPVFVKADGTTTQTVPTGAGIVQQIGFAVSTTEIFVSLKQAMELI